MRPMFKPWLLPAALAIAALFPAREASAVPCAGGNLDFTATSNLPVSGATFNVGQQVDLAAVTTGFTATSLAWAIDGPAIKTYQERIGNTATGAFAWSTTPLAAADLALANIRFYWKPAANQIHPLNAGPSSRNVTLTAQTVSGPCTIAKTFQVERNETDAARQPEDYYTSNHRAAAETNALRGVAIDDHRQWHLDSASRLWAFLPWHGRFLARYQTWRQEFGYALVEPWNPGTPLPTGVAHQHSPRLVYNPLSNLLPSEFSLAAGSNGLAQYATLNAFSSDFEGGFHGDVHCNIGPAGNFGQPSADPTNFGSMCTVASPKDPMFWRWHLFIDVLYRNYCALKGLACDSGPDPATDVWMADNAADLATGGTEPSPSPHWLSIDVWNRRVDNACTPLTPEPAAARDCGSSADHENPVQGAGNFLYATLRNDRPDAQKLVYAEVAVYIANASTGLAWPIDFNNGTPLPETRRFLTLSLAAGQSVDIGPLPWTAPNPSPSDHFCLYVRVLTVQDSLVAESANIDQNTAADNSIAWRNLNIVPAMQAMKAGFVSRFIIRNWRRDDARIDLAVNAADPLLRAGVVRLELDGGLIEAWKKGHGQTKGMEFDGETFLVRSPEARIDGLQMAPRQGGAAAVLLVSKEEMKPGAELVSIRQLTDGKEDGGVDVQLAAVENQERRDLPDLLASGERIAVPPARRRFVLAVDVANMGGSDAPGSADSEGGYRIEASVVPKDRARPRPILPRPSNNVVSRDIPTPSLKAGESARLDLPIRIPRRLSAGDYCLVLRIDSGGAIAESDEMNNESCIDLKLGN